MLHWAMAAWGGWLLASLTPWPHWTCPRGVTAFGAFKWHRE